MSTSHLRTKILFVCDQNRLRSPTAEALFRDDVRLDVRSAGIAAGATVPVTRELLEWADVVFVMERRQRNVIHKRFRDVYEGARIICLYIPDEYDYMDPTLVHLLSARVAQHLPIGGAEV